VKNFIDVGIDTNQSLSLYFFII